MAQQLGKYTLDKKIGSGGMADVWLAQGPRGVCVVKTPHPHLCDNPDFVRMFLDEAALLAQLHHPGIAQIYDLGQEKGRYFLAMEYVPGFDLMTISLEHERHGELMSPELCARIVADAAAALHYAHEAKGQNGQPLHLIHRDVTPHNILLSRQGVVKLIDFGVAKASNAMHRTQAGLVKGKYPYMSPEQIAGQVIDRRVDVYALGLVLYELLTNVRAIAGNTEVDQIKNAQAGNVRPIEQLRPNVPVPLRQILGGCLFHEVEGRYPTALAVKEDLEKFLTLERHVLGQDDLLRLFRVVAADVGEVGLDARLTEPEQPVSNPSGPVVVPDSGKIDELGYSATEPSLKMPALKPLQLGPAQVSSSPQPRSNTTDAVEVPKSKAPMIALAGLSLLIIGLVLALWQPWAGPETPSAIDAGVAAVEIPEKLEKFTFPTEDAGVEAPVDAGTAVAELIDAGPAPVAEVLDAGVPPVAVEPDQRAVLVTVTSVVEADVFVDGKPYGRTPQELQLTAGAHQIIVRNLAEGLDRKFNWKLKPGETKTLAVPAPSAAPPPVAKKGALHVSAPPFCELKVDGKQMPGPPVAVWDVEVSAGTHMVSCALVDPSLPRPRVKAQQVTVEAGGVTRIEFNMLVE